MATPQVEVQDIPDFVNPLDGTEKLLGDQGGTTGLALVSDIDEFTKVTPFVPNIQTGTTYTLTASDNGKAIIFTNASAVTITLPEQDTETLAVGFSCLIRTRGAGGGTIVAEGSDTIAGNTATGASSTGDAGISLSEINAGVNAWDVFGGV